MYGEIDHGLELFEQYVRSNPILMSKLEDLCFKHLGVFRYPQYRTHADVLIKLLDEQEDKSARLGNPYVFQVCHSKGLVCFKGSKCPLSNLYEDPLDYKEYTFISVQHAFLQEKAKAMGLKIHEENLLKAKNGEEIMTTMHKLQQIPCYYTVWDDIEAIQIMYELLINKYAQCPEFVEYIKLYKGMNFLEATMNSFWAIKKDIKDVRLMVDDLTKYEGNNIMGWLLRCFCFWKHSSVHLVLNDVPFKDRNAPIYKGLKMVALAVSRFK